MAKKTKTTASTPVEAHTHDEKRTNIPTQEMHELLDDEVREGTPTLYPRDPDLDPQLVWRGKDQLDAQPLEVPALPLFIQEKIDPRVIVENLRQTASGDESEPEMTLFDEFDGVEGIDQIEFYEHAANWSNRLILGDSLLVMNSLAEKEKLRGQVQTVFLDPPYGIKFQSNWQVSTRKRDVKDGKDVSRQPEQVRAFRDTWRNGINSYLSYLRDRLIASRELLAESGSIFVQIGDENVHVIRNLLDEVFGPDNFCSLITFKKTSGATSQLLAGINDYILWYAKDRNTVKYRRLFLGKEPGGQGSGQYTWLEEPDGTRRRASTTERLEPGKMVLFRPDQLTSQRPPGDFPVEVDGTTYRPTPGYWKTNEDGMRRLALAGRLLPLGNTLSYVRFIDDFPAYPITNLWDDTVTSGFGDPKRYVVQTNTKVIARCIHMTTDPGDLVLDPTCGSGTTAYVAEQWGRRWITIDTSRVAVALARTRLMSAKYPYYLLADSVNGQAKEADITGEPPRGESGCRDIRQGFVYKRVPHITLKDIARNEKITEGLTEDQIRKAVAQGSEQELLLDQPHEDRKTIRVTGPFTAETLSPHRTLDDPTGSAVPADTGDFTEVVVENLTKAGIQNTFKGERLTLDGLEPFPGEGVIQAHGSFADADGEARSVAVAIGPEHGTVSSELIKDAAREATKGRGFDLVVVCGFAFEAYAAETAKEFAPESDGFAIAVDERKLGKVRVLLTRMNPDLTMSDELLKKTGAGNLFMVFGEPDIDIAQEDGEVTVEIHGLDVYDPTTGVVRASSTDDIACWFIDTNYNGESFFVRHAYFTGADKPYEKLQKALKADIDGDAWVSLYSTVSRSFDPPATGSIAVKVINHYGDEVLQVYEVGA